MTGVAASIGVYVTEVQKVPVSKLLILEGNLGFLLPEWRICVGLRFSIFLAGMCRL
jgi:hypothetical protein